MEGKGQIWNVYCHPWKYYFSVVYWHSRKYKPFSEYSRILDIWLKFFLIHLWDSSTVFSILLRNFTSKRKFPSCISRNIWTICVSQPLFIAIYCMRPFVSHGKFIFRLTLVSACLIISVGKVAPPVKFISSKHSSSMGTIIFQKD